jgi:hypothetical protein
MRTAWATGAPNMPQQARVMTRDRKVKRDDLHALEDALHEGVTAWPATLVGEFDADRQLGGGNRGDRDVRVVIRQIVAVGVGAFERDQRPGVQDQSRHGPRIGASPASRRISARSRSQSGSGAWVRTNARN